MCLCNILTVIWCHILRNRIYVVKEFKSPTDSFPEVTLKYQSCLDFTQTLLIERLDHKLACRSAYSSTPYGRIQNKNDIKNKNESIL